MAISTRLTTTTVSTPAPPCFPYYPLHRHLISSTLYGIFAILLSTPPAHHCQIAKMQKQKDATSGVNGIPAALSMKA
ncbi:hypothetical protein NUW54_g3604 [Trametes sanguinea]|uniref:Uncharacterized protein n=1 Tax=Trametes sanguinea TaxID=158606 RepID=A0ACC1Q2G1_9APHY|nr:hypothetical protein NUW54_g3604 [Trametes sanguinea]